MQIYLFKNQFESYFSTFIDKKGSQKKDMWLSDNIF